MARISDVYMHLLPTYESLAIGLCRWKKDANGRFAYIMVTKNNFQ